MANVKILLEYPMAPGAMYEVVLDVTGPTSYTPVVVGTPPTGGQTVFASDFGFKEIHSIEIMGSDNGQYDAVTYINTGPTGIGNPLQRAGTQFQMQWLIAVGRGEVINGTNLSGRTIRLAIDGR